MLGSVFIPFSVNNSFIFASFKPVHSVHMAKIAPMTVLKTAGMEYVIMKMEFVPEVVKMDTMRQIDVI